MTSIQKSLLQEVLAKLNHRRARRGRSRLGYGSLPPLPPEPTRYYLVDSYRVRRHWRRLPRRVASSNLQLTFDL
jgi:hypothetical protein